MARDHHRDTASGPSQRALRAGEVIRHAIADILSRGEVHDPVLEGHLVTVPEVRMSPDLRHAICFVEPLGGQSPEQVVDALNRHAKFLRGRLGRNIEMKFTPDLKFLHDESFNEAARMNRLFENPRVQQDLASHSEMDED